MTTKRQKRQAQNALQPGQNIAPPVPEQFQVVMPRMPTLEDFQRERRSASPPGHPAHQLRPEQWVLLELSKAAMYTADEAYPSARDAVHQLDSLKKLTREILEFTL